MTLEEIIRNQYRIWHNTSANKSIKYRFVVYSGTEPEAQFKTEENATLYIEAKVNQERKNHEKA